MSTLHTGNSYSTLNMKTFYSYQESSILLPHLKPELYNRIRDKFPSLLENVILGSLKSFFQLHHRVEISIYLKEATALYYCRELASLKPP